ncbi:hypothetical protein BS47DRAFT_1401861 [Hydnum rufescens UP504]|uniref:Uncharacterized protein n=1 Tax=Hydnum rufescens UP504 TaxID=1448309 RepID=A0A9P6AFJ7_9AGAM|nr:hypothetical protein BS47DRAFT_1401861 [Hydnum rufescens UP504]
MTRPNDATQRRDTTRRETQRHQTQQHQTQRPETQRPETQRPETQRPETQRRKTQRHETQRNNAQSTEPKRKRERWRHIAQVKLFNLNARTHGPSSSNQPASLQLAHETYTTQPESADVPTKPGATPDHKPERHAANENRERNPARPHERKPRTKLRAPV